MKAKILKVANRMYKTNVIQKSAMIARMKSKTIPQLVMASRKKKRIKMKIKRKMTRGMIKKLLLILLWKRVKRLASQLVV